MTLFSVVNFPSWLRDVLIDIASGERRVASAIDNQTKAILRIVRVLEPARASRVTLSTVAEQPNIEEIVMDQYHIGQEGFKAQLRFNGVIDGEPTVESVGPGTMTQDPKIEQPSADDPSKNETLVNCHFRNSDPTATGVVSVHVMATVDDPDTPDVETIDQLLQAAEWIPPTQAKATSVTLSTSSEPV